MNRHGMQELASRVEALLDELHDAPDPLTGTRAEELVRALLELYGAGLARVVDLLGQGPGGEAMVRRLADDDLVGALLVLHDLHPDDVDTRVQRALDRVRPYLGSHAGGVDYAGVDEAGVAHLRLEGSCDGCPSSSVTVRLTVERAVLDAAPELVAVEVEGMVDHPSSSSPLLQIGRPPSEAAAGWEHLDIPAAGQVVRREVAGLALAVCALGDTPYAYRDQCPGCAAALSGGALEADVLTCPTCGSRYDVRLAGRALSPDARHLDPLPLLPDGAGWRVAVPAGATA